MKKVLIFIAVITCTSFVNTATAKTIEGTVYVTCPGGFFCTNNGKYYTTTAITDDFWSPLEFKMDLIPTYMYGPAELVTPGWGMMSDEQFCAVCNGQHDSLCAYCADEYDEVWVSTWFGFYGAKNNDVTNHSWRGSAFAGVFPCPGTYPSSDSGASSVFQCYRTTSNGEKEYYKTPNKTTHNYDGNYNTEDVNALLTNLQSAIDQANSASQNLQAVLKKNNNHINVPSREKIITTHANNTNDTPVASNTNIQPTSPTTGTTNSSNSQTNTTGTTTTTSITAQNISLPLTTAEKKFDFGNLVSPFADRSATQQKRQPVQTTHGRATRITPQIKKTTISPQSAQQSPAHRSNNNPHRPSPRQ